MRSIAVFAWLLVSIIATSGLARGQEAKLPSPQAEKTEYSSAGISSRVFHILKRGDYAPMAETWGFVFKPKQGGDRYWLINLEKIKSASEKSQYMVLQLDGRCARSMPEFHSIPGQCVKQERWSSWPKIKTLIRQGLSKSEYTHLYPQLEKYTAGKKP